MRIRRLFGKPSVYLSLGVIIVSAVMLIATLDSLYFYFVTRDRIETEMKADARHTADSLSNNIGSFIIAYAVNEYGKLIANEMQSGTVLSVVVEDYNMGKVVGQHAFVSGRIRDLHGKVMDFTGGPSQQELIDGSFYSISRPVISGKEHVGRVSIYLSDERLREQFKGQVVDNLIRSLSISLLLIVLLFVSIRIRLLRPIQKIISTISKQDDEGLPVGKIEVSGPDEINALSRTMNKMIDAIGSSRAELHGKQQELERERERFKLAIEGTQDGLWDWDLVTGETYHSPRYATMLGYQRGELPATMESWRGLLHPDDRRRVEERINR